MRVVGKIFPCLVFSKIFETLVGLIYCAFQYVLFHIETIIEL